MCEEPSSLAALRGVCRCCRCWLARWMFASLLDAVRPLPTKLTEESSRAAVLAQGHYVTTFPRHFIGLDHHARTSTPPPPLLASHWCLLIADWPPLCVVSLPHRPNLSPASVPSTEVHTCLFPFRPKAERLIPESKQTLQTLLSSGPGRAGGSSPISASGRR